MRHAKTLFTALLAAATVGLAPAHAQDKLGSPDWNYEIAIGGGSATGNSRIFASAIGKVLTDNVEGVRGSGAVVPGYDAESAIRTHDGSLSGGVGTPLTIQNAVNGVAPFPSEGIDLKFWFSHNDVALNILALESLGISMVGELKDKTVALAPRGTSNYLFCEKVLAANGVSMDDITVRYMNTSEAISQLQNRAIDAMCYVRAYSGAVLELSTARDVVWLQPSEESIAKIQEELPWAGPIDYPFAEQYTEIKTADDPKIFVSPEFMFLDSDLPNDLVYAMTKAVWENVEVLQNSSNVFAHVNLQDALKRVPIDPHPGAIQYYKEMNVPGWEQYEEFLPAD